MLLSSSWIESYFVERNQVPGMLRYVVTLGVVKVNKEKGLERLAIAERLLIL